MAATVTPAQETVGGPGPLTAPAAKTPLAALITQTPSWLQNTVSARTTGAGNAAAGAVSSEFPQGMGTQPGFRSDVPGYSGVSLIPKPSGVTYLPGTTYPKSALLPSTPWWVTPRAPLPYQTNVQKAPAPQPNVWSFLSGGGKFGGGSLLTPPSLQSILGSQANYITPTMTMPGLTAPPGAGAINRLAAAFAPAMPPGTTDADLKALAGLMNAYTRGSTLSYLPAAAAAENQAYAPYIAQAIAQGWGNQQTISRYGLDAARLLQGGVGQVGNAYEQAMGVQAATSLAAQRMMAGANPIGEELRGMGMGLDPGTRAALINQANASYRVGGGVLGQLGLTGLSTLAQERAGQMAYANSLVPIANAETRQTMLAAQNATNAAVGKLETAAQSAAQKLAVATQSGDLKKAALYGQDYRSAVSARAAWDRAVAAAYQKATAQTMTDWYHANTLGLSAVGKANTAAAEFARIYNAAQKANSIGFTSPSQRIAFFKLAQTLAGKPRNVTIPVQVQGPYGPTWKQVSQTEMLGGAPFGQAVGELGTINPVAAAATEMTMNPNFGYNQRPFDPAMQAALAKVGPHVNPGQTAVYGQNGRPVTDPLTGKNLLMPFVSSKMFNALRPWIQPTGDRTVPFRFANGQGLVPTLDKAGQPIFLIETAPGTAAGGL
jgi:hypothetical protein